MIRASLENKGNGGRSSDVCCFGTVSRQGASVADHYYAPIEFEIDIGRFRSSLASPLLSPKNSAKILVYFGLHTNTMAN